MKLWFGLWMFLFSSIAAFGRADDTALAKEKIEEGKRLIAEEKYSEALEAFESSYSLRPKPWVLFNIAMCNKALHRYVDAISSFQQFLKSETDPDAKTRELALSALAELEQLVGKVRLSEAPQGAQIYIDGEKVGEAPLREPLALDPGRHVVRVSKDRFKTLDVEVIVASGSEVEVRADLQQPKAELKVSCQGDKTVVFIDETAVGKCPYQGTVEPGVHEIKVIEPGKETYVQTVEAAAGSMLVIAVDLKPVIVIKPPTFISDPASTDDSRVPLSLRASGIGALGLGAVSIIIGGVLTAKWNNQYTTVKNTVEAVNAANQPDKKKDWDDIYATYEDKRDRAENLRSGLIAGYAVGGGLIAAGAVLFIVGKIAGKKNETAFISVMPRAEGVAIEF